MDARQKPIAAAPAHLKATVAARKPAIGVNDWFANDQFSHRVAMGRQARIRRII